MTSASVIDERFFEKFVPEPMSGCWLWTAARVPRGYGIFCPPSGRTYAHRWAYTRFVGRIPRGRHIHHRCDTPECVNPGHLEALTPAEHARRSEPARRERCPKGHLYDDRNTYRYKGRGARACRACHRDLARDRRSRERG